MERYIEKISGGEDRFEMFVELRSWYKAADVAAKLKDPQRLQEVRLLLLIAPAKVLYGKLQHPHTCVDLVLFRSIFFGKTLLSFFFCDMIPVLWDRCPIIPWAVSASIRLRISARTPVWSVTYRRLFQNCDHTPAAALLVKASTLKIFGEYMLLPSISPVCSWYFS